MTEGSPNAHWLLRPLENFFRNNKRSTQFLGAALGVIISSVLVTGFVLYSAYLDRQVEIRKHNLDVFYKSMTCDDLPLKGNTSVSECEQAIGRFIIKEKGLFTIHN